MKIDDFLDRYEDIAFSDYHRNVVKIMLQDLLTLAAEKARIIETRTEVLYEVYVTPDDLLEVDKNSILNILSDE